MAAGHTQSEGQDFNLQGEVYATGIAPSVAPDEPYGTGRDGDEQHHDHV